MRQRTIKAAVKLEMKRIARQKIKEEIKSQGLAPRLVTAKEIARLTKLFLASPEAKWVEQRAKENVEILSSERS